MPSLYTRRTLMGLTGLSLCAIAALAAANLTHPGAGSNKSGRWTRERRLDAIRRAKVWTATDVRSKNLAAGPQGPLAFAAGATVTCAFLDRPHGKGSTLKFACVEPSGRELKVRYGRENGEVYAQVAATRLMWALGFGATPMYPVTVVCRGCPQNPFADHAPPSGSAPVVFNPATIEVKLEGQTIETTPDEGWSWKELDLIDEAAGGAPRAHRDALKLLAVLMQHSSNKAINQRLLCLDKPACSHVLMMIVDAGKTFGRANLLNDDDAAAVNFKAWSAMPVWKESGEECVGNLPWSLTGTLHDTRIGEPGRKFLADLLSQLTDAQLHDLFAAARVTARDPHATIADWVAAFKQKRSDIVNRHCPA